MVLNTGFGYGLDKDLNKANRMSHLLQSGIVWVNCWLIRDLRTPLEVKESNWEEGGAYALNFFRNNQCLYKL